VKLDGYYQRSSTLINSMNATGSEDKYLSQKDGLAILKEK